MKELLSPTQVDDLLGNLAKAFLIWASGFVYLYAAGGEGRELVTPLIPAIGYLAAAYNVPLRRTMAPSEKRRMPRDPDALD